VECFKLFPIDQHHVKHDKVNRVPGYQDNVVNDECFELFPVDQLLVETLPFVLGRGYIYEGTQF
jgi:hypothetical protein